MNEIKPEIVDGEPMCVSECPHCEIFDNGIHTYYKCMI
jgi:hypothetical protein